MAKTRLSFPTYSFRRIETPFDKKPGYRNYVAVVEVSDLPDLKDWRRINVRDPKLTGSLPREIKDSFLSRRETFLFFNRGIVISIAGVEFKAGTDEKTGTLTLILSDQNLHGLLDGGHTYEILMQNRGDLEAKGEKQFVKLELIEGFDTDELVNLVDARNSSNQVKDESLLNLDQKFEEIKECLQGQPYSGHIAYKEYETFPDGTPKPISIREIISLLMTMDRQHFSASVHPINTYRSKAACLNHFREHPEAFKKIYPIAPEILKLWDTIHLQLPELYNAVRGEKGDVTGGRFGKLTGVAYSKGSAWTLDFTGKQSSYSIPAGFKYPILGAFRAILEDGGRRYKWGIDPFEMFSDGLGKDLARTIGEFALDAQNPSKTGKSQIVWQSCYQSAELAYLRATRK